jgi:hypothetical protein
MWYGAGAALAFAVPFLFSGQFEFHHDLYLLVYFAVIGAFLGLYVTSTHVDVVDLFRRSWRLSLGLGILSTAFVVLNVLRQDATPRPDGAYVVFELLWRGLLYGTVDALLLTAFPVAVTYAVFRNRVSGWGRRAGFAVLAFVLVVTITATYHLGYAQYREDGIANPEVGNTVISVPALVSTNPLGSVVTHAAMHVTAVAHVYETDVFLPPQTSAK